jgi:hypothetical protein
VIGSIYQEKIMWMKAADSSNPSGKTRDTQKSVIAAIVTQAAGLHLLSTRFNPLFKPAPLLT